MINTVRETDGLEDETARKVDFYTRQFMDAMAPTNFAISNPEVLRETAETKGQNLVKGLSNLLDDLEKGKGQLRIKHVDEDAFELGKNIATSPGKVVFQNDLLQLIQFIRGVPQRGLLSRQLPAHFGTLCIKVGKNAIPFSLAPIE